ncbi:hypothetical protein ACSBR1_027957 [Camellia fascicularis]
MSQYNQNQPQVAYAYPVPSTEGPYVVPPPVGYPMKDGQSFFFLDRKKMVNLNDPITTNLFPTKLNLGPTASGRDVVLPRVAAVPWTRVSL